MSCKERRDKIALFLFIIAVYSNTFQVCHSVSLGQQEKDLAQVQESPAARWERTEQVHGWHLVEKDIRGPGLPKSSQIGSKAAVFPGQSSPHFNAPILDDSLSWTVGEIRTEPMSSAADAADGYQADFTGFHGVHGKVMDSSFDSNPHFPEWLATRLQCGDGVMTFTASGEEFTHLLVDREGASPISLFQLPPYCGYSVKTSLSDLQIMMPYDACYITQENGSYVLPVLWSGSPLKLSCPVQISTPFPHPARSVPSVLCSAYGMLVRIQGQEQDEQILGVTVKGGWRPFVSEECAYRVSSHPGELSFFISYTTPCITIGDRLHLHLALDDQEYILSCPVHPHAPSPPQFPYIPDSILPAPASPSPPPQLPNQEQIVQFPENPHYTHQEVQFPQLPHVYPPGPQSTRPSKPTLDSPPGTQQQQQQLHLQQQQQLHLQQQQQQQLHLQQQQQLSIYPTGSDDLPYSFGQHPKFPSSIYHPAAVEQTSSSLNLSPVQGSSAYLPRIVPVDPSEYSYGGYYYVPYYYPAVTPPPTSEVKKATTAITVHDYPPYYLQIPYYPAHTVAPVTPSPAPSPPKQSALQYPSGSFYPLDFYSSYYHTGKFSYPGVEVVPAPISYSTVAPPSPLPPPATTSTTKVMVPKEPDRPSYPSAKDIHQTPQAICPPYAHTMCSYHPYPYYPYYHPLYPPHYGPLYPPVTPYPQVQPVTTITPTTTTTTTTTSSPTAATAGPTLQSPHLQCLTGRMIVFLPFAHPDSIQVRDYKKTWLFLSSVPSACGYMLQMAEGSGVILHSPLPACHSQPRTLTTISLPLRFWDLSLAQYRTLDLQCPYQTAPGTPAPVTPPVLPTQPSATKGKAKGKTKTSPVVVPKPNVSCSSLQMTVELPPGPFSGIAVKDVKGNQMNLQDVPKHCGYSASKGKDGKISLRLPLHSRCHMSVQGKMYIITVVYMTLNGRKEGQFFCPVVIPVSGQECNLPSEQRLPCGHGSVSQPRCVSMGCCFSNAPPACYYPMDECTIDRHFVFSVPASLTEPPLSPALLVAAGDPACTPQRVTSDYALFKIPMDGCGTRRVTAGKTVIYMVEIINKVKTISLNYGTITRDSPVRMFVECRFLPGAALSVSYLVKTPSLGPDVQTQGMFGVQLRIAKDAQYSSYYPQYHQPLQMLLGKPLYLEVRLLNSPDPSLRLLVHFCVAYPRSGKAVWLLLYNGCPNPLDPALQQAVLSHTQPPSPAQTRRFTISTFQFLPDGELKDMDEEIYFMCSTEICSPHDGPCVEGCFGQ